MKIFQLCLFMFIFIFAFYLPEFPNSFSEATFNFLQRWDVLEIWQGIDSPKLFMQAYGIL